MKYLLGLLILTVWFFIPTSTQAYTPNDFVITVNTANNGASASNQFTLPTVGSGFDALVDWGDGSTTTLSGSPGNVTHTYSVPGTYQIVITPNVVDGFPRIRFDNDDSFFSYSDSADNFKITEINQWGTNQWTSMRKAFVGCDNLAIIASDIPNLSNVTDMVGMFGYNDSSDLNVATWDVSNVMDISRLFIGASAFNEDISAWDVSNVTTMAGVFQSAATFNQPLDSWDVSNVTSMESMFYQASAFNQTLSNWDVSNVTDMIGIFGEATAFNQDISAWVVSSATDMSYLFNDSGLSKENYSNILNGWAALPSLQNNVILGATGISYLDTATTARQFLSDTYSWTINDGGLYAEPSSNTFVSIWDTTLDGNTPNELELFVSNSNSTFTIDWGDGTTQYVAIGQNSYINHTYSTPGIKTVTITGTFPYFYAGCGDGDANNKLIDVAQWGTIQWESFENSFAGCTYLESFSATDIPDLSQVTEMNFMFAGATSFNDDLNDWDVSNVTTMDNIFEGATSFNGNIRNWNVANVTSMQSLFRGATSFNQDLSAWDISNASFDWIGFDGTSLSVSNYTKILEAWSQLSLLPMSFGEVGPSSSLTPYCSSVQTAYDLLRSIWYDWTDGGPVSCTTATYLTNAGGALLGDTFQYIADGDGGTAVTVVPADGYRFVSWSDGSTANPRTDSNLTADISVTAILESTDGGSGSNSTAIGVRAERLGEMIANTPVVASITSFVASVRDFLDFLTANEDDIEKMTVEERTQVITALRDVIAFLLRFIPGV